MLSVREVTTAYQGLVAISSVSIDVTKGEIVCVAGANGAGKSTLLKSIAATRRSIWCSSCFRDLANGSTSVPRPCPAASSRCSRSAAR
jgi:ABC-type branched-subunit amino acid transport system ATPase component